MVLGNRKRSKADGVFRNYMHANEGRAGRGGRLPSLIPRRIETNLVIYFRMTIFLFEE